jgi:hypothetical protein
MELSAVVEKAWLFTAAHHQLRGGGFPYQRFLWLVYTVYNTILLLTLIRMTKDGKVLAIFKGLML